MYPLPILIIGRNDKTGIRYTQQGNYYLPGLALPDKE